MFRKFISLHSRAARLPGQINLAQGSALSVMGNFDKSPLTNILQNKMMRIIKNKIKINHEV